MSFHVTTELVLAFLTGFSMGVNLIVVILAFNGFFKINTKN